MAVTGRAVPPRPRYSQDGDQIGLSFRSAPHSGRPSRVPPASGAVALRQPQEMERTRTQVRRLREHLAGHLVAAGTRIDAAGGPFLLCDVGDASRFTGALLRRGVLVRDCTSFGLPRHVRVGVRLLPENELLAERWPREREGLT